MLESELLDSDFVDSDLLDSDLESDFDEGSLVDVEESLPVPALELDLESVT